MKECEIGSTRKGCGCVGVWVGRVAVTCVLVYSYLWGWVYMCVGDVGVHEFSSWESVCIWILWTGMRPNRGSKGK